MLRKNLNLALVATALFAVSGVAEAHDNFVSRMFTAPNGAGRWVDRRLTIRHHDQDAPKNIVLKSGRKEDNFASRMVSEPNDRGRWLNRRLTIRHEGQDRP